MEPRETAAVYDKLAAIWASAVDPQNGIAQHERAIQFTKAGGRAIDVGCGSGGRIIDLLLSRGFAVEGFDISSEMLLRARQTHPAVTFHQGDICTADLPGTYDFISAWDSIWHVPLDLQAAVVTKLCAALNPGGVLIFSAGGVDVPGEVTNPDCHGQPLYHSALGIQPLLRLVDQAECACRHLEFDQLPQSHLYLIVQRLPDRK